MVRCCKYFRLIERKATQNQNSQYQIKTRPTKKKNIIIIFQRIAVQRVDCGCRFINSKRFALLPRFVGIVTEPSVSDQP